MDNGISAEGEKTFQTEHQLKLQREEPVGLQPPSAAGCNSFSGGGGGGGSSRIISCSSTPQLLLPYPKYHDCISTPCCQGIASVPAAGI